MWQQHFQLDALKAELFDGLREPQEHVLLILGILALADARHNLCAHVGQCTLLAYLGQGVFGLLRGFGIAYFVGDVDQTVGGRALCEFEALLGYVCDELESLLEYLKMHVLEGEFSNFYTVSFFFIQSNATFFDSQSTKIYSIWCFFVVAFFLEFKIRLLTQVKI